MEIYPETISEETMRFPCRIFLTFVHYHPAKRPASAQEGQQGVLSSILQATRTVSVIHMSGLERGVAKQNPFVPKNISGPVRFSPNVVKEFV